MNHINHHTMIKCFSSIDLYKPGAFWWYSGFHFSALWNTREIPHCKQHQPPCSVSVLWNSNSLSNKGDFILLCRWQMFILQLVYLTVRLFWHAIFVNLSQNYPDGKRLNTYVVSASVTNATGRIENLKEYVSVTLHHLTTKKVSYVVLSNVQELKKKNTGRNNF